MMGLYLLFLVVVWIVVVVIIAVFVAKRVPFGRWRAPLGVLIALVLFPLPMIDVLVGWVQFNRLCASHATIKLDRSTAKNRVVYAVPVRKPIEGTWIPIIEVEDRYVDAKTGEVVISIINFQARHGFLYISDGPLLFRGYCAPEGQVNELELLESLGMTLVESPNHKAGGAK